MILSIRTSLSFDTKAHAHEVNELIVASSGNAFCRAANQKLAISSAQTVLVPAGVSHRYELGQGRTEAKVTFICFDNSALEQYAAPSLRELFYQLLKKGMTSAALGQDEIEENSRLVAKVSRNLKERGRYHQEIVGSLLNSMLLNHLEGVEAPSHACADQKFASIVRARQWINDHLADEINIDMAADIACMSRTVFTRYFKQYTGLSFANYVASARVRFATSLLLRKKLSVAEVAYQSGYNNLGHFYGQFQKHHGMTPNHYRTLSADMALSPA